MSPLLTANERRNMTTQIENQRVAGRIIKVHKAGWGFISSREIEFTRIFFHWTSLKQSTLTFTQLRTGMIVEFTPVQVPDKGWRAIHIIVTDTREKLHPNESTEITEDSEHAPIPVELDDSLPPLP